jgi:hypothetical protein
MTRRANWVVAIWLVGLCVPLLFVAAMKVREAADRSRCKNTALAIGIGLQNYASAFHDRFPAGTAYCPTLPPEQRLGWPVDMGPYADLDPFRRWCFDRSKPWNDEENLWFLCWRKDEPGRPDPPRKWVPVGPYWLFLCPAVEGHNDPTPGPTHYVGVAGIGSDTPGLPAEENDRRIGMFGYDRRHRFDDFKDGLANTLAVLETHTDCGPWTAGGPSTVRGLDPAGRPYLGMAAQFGGRHGTAAAGFADGSARPLSYGIAPGVLEALATLAGGEAMPEGGLPGE